MTFAFGPFRLDTTARRLWREGREIALPSRAFDALAHLVRHRDRPVDKDELIKAVWSGAFVSDDSLVHCVSVIRRALQDDVDHPRFVATLPRRGYQFVWAEVETADVAPAMAPSEDGPGPPAGAETAWHRRRWAAVLGLAVAAVMLLVAGIALRREDVTTASDAPVLLAQLPPAGATLASGGLLSPDGRHLAFVARDHGSGVNRLWVRALDSAHARVIAGTEGATKPFWARDSQSLGYFAGDKLRTVALVGESTRTVANLSVSAGGGTWGPGDVIVFSDTGRGLYAIEAGGGSPRALTTLDPGRDAAHAWPHFLPDGRHVLYTVSSWNSDRAGIWVASFEPGEAPRRITGAASPAIYAPEGFLVYVAGDALVAAPFDAGTRAVEGAPIPLVRGVLPPRLTDGDIFSMNGSLLSYRGGSRVEQLTWFTRDGRRAEAIESPTALYNPMISPDGTQLVATGSPARAPGLWMVDFQGHASTRLAPDAIGPLWSPDGRHIIYSRTGGQTGLDLWLLPVAEPHKSSPLLATTATERGARISPDGNWLAYVSDESGTSEVYVQEFPGLGSKRGVSSGGGAGVFWRRDGRELYYLSADRTLMAVDVGMRDTITLGRPRPLFRAPVAGDVSEARNHYAAAPDGQRFLINVVEESPDRAAISILVNWKARLAQHPSSKDRRRP